MVRNLADRLLDAIDEKKNPSVVGLDPVLGKIPEHIKNRAKRCYGNTAEGAADAIRDFNTLIIDEIADIVPAVKPQSAHYERFGPEGVKAYKYTIDYAKKAGLIVIADVKRNDIGKTSKAYAEAYLGETELFDGVKTSSFDVDITTVNGYLGTDGIKPFLEVCKEFGKGIFILDKTSNPSSGEFQDRKFESGEALSDAMARKIDEWGKELIGERDYSSVGAVVGATYPTDALRLVAIMPKAIKLIPGYGDQGGRGEDIPNFLNDDGYGGIVNNSSGINFAYQKEPYKNEFKPTDFHKASRKSAIDMRDDIVGAMKKAGKLPDGW